MSFSKNHWLTLYAVLLVMGITSCKPETKYSGDGVLTHWRGVLLTPNYKIQMPQIDISKPHVETYDLGGLPPSKGYAMTLEVLYPRILTPSDSGPWGVYSFKVVKNGTVIHVSSSEFYKTRNCFTRDAQGYLNELYIEGSQFMVPDNQDHWELIFECPGFDSPGPVWAHILLRSGGV